MTTPRRYCANCGLTGHHARGCDPSTSQELPPWQHMPPASIMRTSTVANREPVQWRMYADSRCSGAPLATTRMMPVFRPPQLPREPRSAHAGIPRWSVVLMALGVLLMALGLVLNGPISELLYGVIR